MPFIVENGITRFVTQAELDAYNQASTVPGTAPAGGTLLNLTPTDQTQLPEQYLIPNTTNARPGQDLPETFESYASPPTAGENDLVFLNTGENLGTADQEGFVQSNTGLNFLPEDVETPPGENDLVFLNKGKQGFICR